MARRKKETETDLEVCKRKIESILLEFNCELMDMDESNRILLYDRDTRETTNIKSK